MLDGCGDLDFARLGEIGDVEAHGEVAGGARGRPVGIDGNAQGFDVKGAVVGEREGGEKQDEQQGRGYTPKTPLLSRGGVAARPGKNREATFERADGVVMAEIP